MEGLLKLEKAFREMAEALERCRHEVIPIPLEDVTRAAAIVFQSALDSVGTNRWRYRLDKPPEPSDVAVEMARLLLRTPIPGYWGDNGGSHPVGYTYARSVIAGALYAYGECHFEDNESVSKEDLEDGISRYVRDVADLAWYRPDCQHCGDCMDLPMTCLRCLIDEYNEKAEEVLNVLNLLHT